MVEDVRDSADEAEFSLEAIIASQRRMRDDPDAVTDDEIIAEYGPEPSPNEVRDLFRRTTFNRISKNPRASARTKLRRRMLWLTRSFEEVESAIADVRSAPGRTNKLDELEGILTAIHEFRSAVNLPTPPEPPEIEFDLFECLLDPDLHKSKE